MVTGASSGIGEACARRFAKDGYSLALGARRTERLGALATEFRSGPAEKVFHAALDVTQKASVLAFVEQMKEEVGIPDILVNNAGLARGVERLEDAQGEAWREMVETNLFGVLYVSRQILPAMIEQGSGTIIMIGSISGHRAYAGGSVYCATKRALQSVCQSMRMETLGKNIRVCSVDPGLVETEFSLVRFSGDKERADKVYEGIQVLRAEDIADCVHFSATRPAHVNVDDMIVMPTIQADPYHLHRGEVEQG